jgi:hypothetical protein
MSETSARNLLGLWADKSFPMFISFKFGDSSGSTRCVIAELSTSILRLSWEPHGELIVPLEKASFDISKVDPTEVLSGSDWLGKGEECVSIVLPSNDWCLLVMMRPSAMDDI